MTLTDHITNKKFVEPHPNEFCLSISCLYVPHMSNNKVVDRNHASPE